LSHFGHWFIFQVLQFIFHILTINSMLLDIKPQM